jgi:superfamily II DNA or RNA helicase
MKWRRKQTPDDPRNRRKRKRKRPAASPQPHRASTRRDEEGEHLQYEEAAERQRKQKVSRGRKPAGMSLEEWQRELRRQFGREQSYTLENVGDHRLFSEFDITNPKTERTYRVHIRGSRPGDNYCSCPDFASNNLGTCKHIEFTLATLERRRGAAKELRAGFQPEWSEVFLHYGARREVRFRPGSECPADLARLGAEFFDAEGALLPDVHNRFEHFLRTAGELEHELRCYDDVLTFVAELRDAERRREKVNEAFPRGIRSAAFRDLLRVELYDYQKEGVLFATRSGRCLLGDEMGLGKSIQGIAVAEVMARLFGVERVLIVCPTSLKHQWEREIIRCGDRPVRVVNGLRPRRERQYGETSFFKIINYDTVYRDLDLIHGWSPDLVILDEAQRIKNWETRTARSVKRIQSPYALVLTGTPLENRLEELISIVQFVDPYRLGPTYKLLHDHQERDEFGKVIGYHDLDRIGKTLEPILLRRHKIDVLDQLPERIDTNLFMPMTDLQRHLHDENKDVIARIVEKWKRYGFLSESDQRKLMIALQRMRMACDSAYLVDHTHDVGPKADEAITLLEEMLEDEGVKVVIFSQWLRMHELLVRRIKRRGWKHVLFHGGVPSGKRKDLIDRFCEDPDCRLFLSTDSGGTGLNLQHATVVINMDLPWNPAVLEQRIGRVHRLGQTQPVRVVNFVAQGTIEEGMLSVIKFKKSLFAGVLDGGEKDVFLGGTKLNRFMETVEKVSSAIPEAMLEDAEAAIGAEIHPDEEPPRRGRRGRRGGRGARSPDTAPAPMPAAAGGTMVPAADPWGSLLQAGLGLLQQLAGATQRPNGQAAHPAAGNGGPSFLRRDESTGETYLRLPVPPPEVIEQAAQALGSLLQSLRG